MLALRCLVDVHCRPPTGCSVARRGLVSSSEPNTDRADRRRFLERPAPSRAPPLQPRPAPRLACPPALCPRQPRKSPDPDSRRRGDDAPPLNARRPLPAGTERHDLPTPSHWSLRPRTCRSQPWSRREHPNPRRVGGHFLDTTAPSDAASFCDRETRDKKPASMAPTALQCSSWANLRPIPPTPPAAGAGPGCGQDAGERGHPRDGGDREEPERGDQGAHEPRLRAPADPT